MLLILCCILACLLACTCAVLLACCWRDRRKRRVIVMHMGEGADTPGRKLDKSFHTTEPSDTNGREPVVKPVAHHPSIPPEASASVVPAQCAGGPPPAEASMATRSHVEPRPLPRPSDRGDYRTAPKIESERNFSTHSRRIRAVANVSDVLPYVAQM